jgi:hypothetical protein
MKGTELIMILLLTSCANSYIPTSNTQSNQDEVIVCKDYGKYAECIISDKQSAEYELQRVLSRY